MADITQNPDYRLVMTFLQNIRPGDMDQESADQLMMIGQRMQAGGALTEREREMFTSVVGAMPQMPIPQMTNEQREAFLRLLAPGSAVREGEMPIPQMTNEQREAFLRLLAPGSAVREQTLPSQDGVTYSPSSGVTYSPSSGENTMDMQQMIDAGIISPTRPKRRPTAPMTSTRPMPRPM